MKKIIELFKSIIEFLKNRKKVTYIPFPISLSTVDIVITKVENDEEYVLLGRKKNETYYQFPGGFRDPGERSREAAKRECMEETTLDINLIDFYFVDDMFINDKRYMNTPHKITTNVFWTCLGANDNKNAIAGDDLVEVKWFKVNELKDNYKTIIRNIHHQMVLYRQN